MNTSCPSCEMENAYLEIVDENGSHYRCPDCEHEWTDTDSKAENNEGENSFVDINPNMALTMANKLKKE